MSKSVGAKAVAAYFSFLALISLFLEFNTSRYDWDIDHELYFGQRLARGELVWLTEYNDKLLFQQFLFAPAGVFGEINFWRVMSLGILLTYILALHKYGWELVGKVFPNSRERAMFTFLTALLTSFFISGFPGGLSHLNFFSAGSGMLTIIFLVLVARQAGGVRFWYFSSAAAFFGTLSISVRPYFLLPIALVWLLMFLAEAIRPIASTGANRFRMLWPMTIMGFLGFCLNVLPYFLVGRGEAFIEGLSVLAVGRNPDSAWQSFLIDWTSPPNLIVITGLVLAGIFIVRAVTTRVFSDAPSFLFLTALASIAVVVSIFMRHWWAHYAMMLVPFIALLFAATAVLLFRRLSLFLGGRKANRNRQLGQLAISTFSVFALVLTQGFVERAQSSNIPTESYLETLVIDEWLSADREVRPAFLVPYNMRAHWMLRESRHGFPHAANLLQADLGWWNPAPSTTNFALFSDTSGACASIYRSSVTVIFLPTGSPLGLCFEHSFPQSGKSRIPHQLQNNLVAWTW